MRNENGRNGTVRQENNRDSKWSRNGKLGKGSKLDEDSRLSENRQIAGHSNVNTDADTGSKVSRGGKTGRHKWQRRAGMVTAAAAAVMLLLSGPVTALAKGPGSGDVYEYPGFKGAGPGENTVSSWNYDSDDPWGPAYKGGPFDRGWRYTPDGWWYRLDDGSWPSNGWKCIDSRWYYFEQTGHLKTGWLDKDGYRYYLNPVDDGSLGAMRVGWQIIGGKAYYFNGSSDGVYGALLTNTTTPDGYQVGADGAMIR